MPYVWNSVSPRQGRPWWVLSVALFALCWSMSQPVGAQSLHNPANGHYYEIVSMPGPIDWGSAQGDATVRFWMGVPGHLATITSQAEHDFIVSTLLPTLPGIDMWLGASQPVGSPSPTEGWQWVTGEAFTFSNWAPFAPNDFGNDNGLLMLMDGTWDDRFQFDPATSFYVVEYDTAPLWNPNTGHYYQIVTGPTLLTWFDAEADATTRSFMGAPGRLATISSQAEHDFIVSTLLPMLPIDAWLGGFQLPGSPAPEQGWQWVTGEAFTFSNWAPSVPNDFGNDNGLVMRIDGTWDDTPRSAFFTSAYVIEFEASPAPVCPEPLQVNMTYIDGTLNLEFHLETTTPAIWEVWLMVPGESVRLLSIELPANLTPQQVVPIALPFFPSLGTVAAVTTLSTPEHGFHCSVLTTVDTGPSSGAVPLMALVQGAQARARLHLP